MATEFNEAMATNEMRGRWKTTYKNSYNEEV